MEPRCPFPSNIDWLTDKDVNRSDSTWPPLRARQIQARQLKVDTRDSKNDGGEETPGEWMVRGGKSGEVPSELHF